MSPINALERSYTPIREMLRHGAFAPGARLEANRLANELGVSMTPVRDVLHQLAGERLVEARIGNGFHVPRLSASALRDLYEWNAALMASAARNIATGALRAFESSEATAPEHFAALVEYIAELTPNKEVGSALRNASDRIHPFRILEPRLFHDMDEELSTLWSDTSRYAEEIRQYHLRRMRSSEDLLRLRGGT